MSTAALSVGTPDLSTSRVRIDLDAASKAFPDGTVAVDRISLSVRLGEFVSVVGPSGCGKSTLLRLAAGLTSPTSGTVTRNAGGTGFVFQDPTLLPWRTVQGNVELACELAGIDRDARAARAAEMIELVGLAGFERHRPRALSGGMRMRVSLARALATRPDLFLLDEPFGALDEMTRERLNDELLDIFAASGFAALFVTHSVTEAVYLSNRVLVMSARPGSIVDEVEVPFGYPRSPSLRFDPAFAKVASRIVTTLRGGRL